MKHTDATKNKLSDMRRGSNNPFYGKKHTEETRRYLGEILRRYRGNRQYDINPPTIIIPSGYDLAYFAGLVDGEGSIRFRRFRPFIALYNTDAVLFEWVQEKTGITPHWVDNRGRVPVWHWYVQSAKNVYTLGKALAPFLVVKQADVQAALAALEGKYGRSIEN